LQSSSPTALEYSFDLLRLIIERAPSICSVSFFQQMILVNRTSPLSTSILVRINNEYPGRFHVFSVTRTTANYLILRRSLSAGVRLIISKLIALNLLLLLLISRIDTDL